MGGGGGVGVGESEEGGSSVCVRRDEGEGRECVNVCMN